MKNEKCISLFACNSCKKTIFSNLNLVLNRKSIIVKACDIISDADCTYEFVTSKNPQDVSYIGKLGIEIGTGDELNCRYCKKAVGKFMTNEFLYECNEDHIICYFYKSNIIKTKLTQEKSSTKSFNQVYVFPSFKIQVSRFILNAQIQINNFLNLFENCFDAHCSVLDELILAYNNLLMVIRSKCRCITHEA